MRVLAIDIGSSSTRTALFNQRGRVVPETAAQRKYSLRYTADGGAELSPIELQRAVRACLRETLRSSRAKRQIAALGGSAFWHGLLGLDRKARPLTPIFTWADARSGADAARLRQEFDERKIRAETGCMLRGSYWPAKLRWLRRTDRASFRNVHRWVSPADWIFAQIFGTTGTSYSMASATGLYDLRTKTWHERLCEECGVNPKQLDVIGETPNRSTTREFRDVYIFNAIGDGAAGNLGSGADDAGRVAINIGTSAAVRTLDRSGKAVPFGLFRYVVDRRRFVIGGAVSNAGNLHEWCLRRLRLRITEAKALSRSAAANDDLIILPFWVSERAPTWPENLRGTILNLTQSTDAAAISRAVTCATFYRLTDILELLERKSGRAKQIIVSGGILHSKAALPLLADALGRDICVSAEAEASLRGAAVYVLEKLGTKPMPLPKPKLIRHDRAFAAKHRIRRERQRRLEIELSSFLF
ncbi:MAG: gluconokinase [Chthoniobacterales bacterium]